MAAKVVFACALASGGFGPEAPTSLLALKRCERYDFTMSKPPTPIELRLDTLSHIFDPFDPFPLPSRDLAKGAEEFIVGWAREMSSEVEIELVVHVPPEEVKSDVANGLRDAVSRHFSSRADRISGDVHEMFRVGRLSLAIGVGVLVVCVAGGRLLVGTFGDTPLTRVLVEGLLIMGWVANWRPIEIFLYDWWPLLQRRRLYRRIASAPVTIKAYATEFRP